MAYENLHFDKTPAEASEIALSADRGAFDEAEHRAAVIDSYQRFIRQKRAEVFGPELTAAQIVHLSARIEYLSR